MVKVSERVVSEMFKETNFLEEKVLNFQVASRKSLYLIL